jgi:SAM-dependent methyltransferase
MWEEGDRTLPLKWGDRWALLDDATGISHFDRHYVYHLAWAAQVISEEEPDVHVDIASMIHFPAILSGFMEVEFYDYRPADIHLDRLKAGTADLTQLHFGDQTIQSLSCMSTVEHIGLGRYGDPIDPEGDRKAMAELQRVIAPGGSLLFVVPVGEPRIIFNAHRVYGYEQVVDNFLELDLVEFALIPEHPERGHLIRNAPPALVAREVFACGCFHFRRPALRPQTA